jgi:hypothetical protein
MLTPANIGPAIVGIAPIHPDHLLAAGDRMELR